MFETAGDIKKERTTWMGMISEECQQHFHALLGEFFPHLSYRILYTISYVSIRHRIINSDIVFYDIVRFDTMSYVDVRCRIFQYRMRYRIRYRIRSSLKICIIQLVMSHTISYTNSHTISHTISDLVLIGQVACFTTKRIWDTQPPMTICPFTRTWRTTLFSTMFSCIYFTIFRLFRTCTRTG